MDANGNIVPEASAVGAAFYLGSIQVSFSNYLGSLTNTQTSILNIGAALGKSTTPKFTPYDFKSSENTANTAVYGSNVWIGNGAGTETASPNLAYAPLTFTFTSNSTNPGVLGATLALSGATSGLAGTGLPLAGTVSNTATAPAYTISWNQSGLPGGSTLTPSASTGVAVGAPQSLTGSLTIPAGFGPSSTVVTFTGTDSNGTGSTPITQTLNYNIIGASTLGSGTLTTGVLPQNSSLAGIGASLSTTSATSYGLGQTSFAILAGNVAVSTSISTSWRSPTANELAGKVGAPVYSDVLNLSGVYNGSSSNSTAPYVLQMTYDPNAFAAAIGSEGTAAAITQGLLYLGTYNGSKWISATDPSLNGTAGSAAQQNVGVTVAPGDTFAQWFATEQGQGQTLQTLLGSWGVDTADNAVWAIVDHDAQFAVVPEPGTLALLAAGAVALGVAYRRRKVAKS